MKYLILAFLLVSCASQDTTLPTPKPVETSQDAEPIKDPTGKKLTLWSTFYYSPEYKSSSSGIYVRGKGGKILGPKLSRKDICNLMLQGSGTIDGEMYGYHSKSNIHRVNCRSISSKISGTVKFHKDGSKYGIGVKNWPITPFKSIAVDPRFIPYGSTLFIPALKGIKYKLEGEWLVHDGIVKAQDTGGAIKGNHIDFFVGTNPGGWKDALKDIVNKYGFNKFVKSKSSGTFTAYLLD